MSTKTLKMCSKLKSLKSVLIDLSGTLHIEDTAIPGAVDALKRLRSSGLAVRFVTNTTKESRNFLLNRLRSLGFDINVDEIFTSLTAAKHLIQRLNLKPFLMLEEEALEDFSEVDVVNDQHSNGNAVVVGLAPNKFNYDSMNVAFQMLLSGAKLIAIHKGKYYKRKDGLALGPGPFVSALEYASDIKSIVVGKPQKDFFLRALEPLGCDPSDTVMIGDDIRDDVNGAQSAGITGILVQTGKYRTGDETKINPAPDFVFPSFTEAVNFILSEKT